MKTYLNFGGFYGSDHGVAVEDWVQPDWDSGTRYDWPKAHAMYAEAYVGWFNSLFGTDLKFVSVWSPKVYNIQTDSIEIEVTVEDAEKLKWIAHEEFPAELTETIRYASTARAGYIPYYTEQSIEFVPDRFLECVLTCLLEQVGSDWWDYYNDYVLLQVPDSDEFILETKP